MTARKTSDTDPDIIEGVAVEKPASPAGRRRPAGRGKAAAGQGGAKQRAGKTASGKGTPDDTRNSAADRQEDGSSAGKAPPQRDSLPVILGAAAILLALTGIVIQQWMMARQENRFQSEIGSLAAQIATSSDMLARAEGEILVMKTNQDAVASRLAGLEDALPRDPAEALAALSTRLDALAADLDSRPSGGDSSLPPLESGLALAQAGLGAVTAMNAASLAGGDAARWVPVLRELALAGLDVGDLSGLEMLLTPPPAQASRLVADGVALVSNMKEGREDGSGWWQATTGRIAGFIRLRRSDEATSAEENVVEAATPVEAFARALRATGLAAGLAASRRITPVPEGLANWQAQAQRRLDLDGALAELMAGMTARLAAAGAVD